MDCAIRAAGAVTTLAKPPLEASACARSQASGTGSGSRLLAKAGVVKRRNAVAAMTTTQEKGWRPMGDLHLCIHVPASLRGAIEAPAVKSTRVIYCTR